MRTAVKACSMCIPLVLWYIGTGRVRYRVRVRIGGGGWTGGGAVLGVAGQRGGGSMVLWLAGYRRLGVYPERHRHLLIAFLYLTAVLTCSRRSGDCEYSRRATSLFEGSPRKRSRGIRVNLWRDLDDDAVSWGAWPIQHTERSLSPRCEQTTELQGQVHAHFGRHQPDHPRLRQEDRCRPVRAQRPTHRRPHSAGVLPRPPCPAPASTTTATASAAAIADDRSRSSTAPSRSSAFRGSRSKNPAAVRVLARRPDAVSWSICPVNVPVCVRSAGNRIHR